MARPATAEPEPEPAPARATAPAFSFFDPSTWGQPAAEDPQARQIRLAQEAQRKREEDRAWREFWGIPDPDAPVQPRGDFHGDGSQIQMGAW